MRCGKCYATDVDVAHVKSCYGVQPQSRFNDSGLKPVVPMRPVTERQKDYIMGLQEERVLPESYLVVERDALDTWESADAHSTINLLKTFPRKAATSTNTRKQWEMPEGRYALLHEFGTDSNPDSAWWFFQVDKPTEGRWKGYTFIKRLIGAPGAYRKIDMDERDRNFWLAAIEANPKQAMIDYGLQSGVCGRCASPLTDPDSLARGLGPICAGKTGWF